MVGKWESGKARESGKGDWLHRLVVRLSLHEMNNNLDKDWSWLNDRPYRSVNVNIQTPTLLGTTAS